MAQTPTDLIKQTSQTKHYTGNTRTYAHSEACFDYVWRGLQAGKMLTKDMVIDGVDYRYWKEQLNDLTDRHLKAGLKQSGTFTGYMGWGEFRKLCNEGMAIEMAQNRQAQPPTTARLGDYSSMGNKRFQELAKVTQAMSEEKGDGPITRASRLGKLTKAVIKNKSADEIIEYAQMLYGQ